MAARGGAREVQSVQARGRTEDLLHGVTRVSDDNRVAADGFRADVRNRGLHLLTGESQRGAVDDEFDPVRHPVPFVEMR